MVDSNTTACKPVFLISHSRACSTILERVFWTRPDEIKCFHEPLGEAFYYGPDNVADGYTVWPEGYTPQARPSNTTTYKSALRSILQLDTENPHKHVFAKDIAYHIVPPKDSLITTIPSLKDWEGGEEPTSPPNASVPIPNPTWLPTSVLDSIQFTFLIRDPYLAVPSLYRLHTPPYCHVTNSYHFQSNKIGYRELRMLIEYLYPHLRHDQDREITTIDDSRASPILIEATTLLSNSLPVLTEFCSRVKISFEASMLNWRAHDPQVEKAFGIFPGFHGDAVSSTGFRKVLKDQDEGDDDGVNGGRKEEKYMMRWRGEFGDEGARVIREAVALCEVDYAWLRRFAIRGGWGREGE